MSELWVDTDLGFDDIHALLLLRQHGIQAVAHSLVFGCATLDKVVDNAKGFEATFNVGATWHSGAAYALDGHCRTAAHVLGETGMQSRGLTLSQDDSESDALVQRNSAVRAMITWLSGNPVDPQILALGPLTNLAQLITEAPQIAAKLSCITWMGGSCGRGNQTEHAEFNAWADAKAADIVMQSGIHVHLVELEACRELLLVPEDLTPLSLINTPTAHVLHDLLGGYLDIGLSRGRTGMALYDPLAAAAVILASASDNSMLSSTTVRISVESNDNEQMGQTHVEPTNDSKHSAHTLCVVDDADAVHDMLMNALITTATNDGIHS